MLSHVKSKECFRVSAAAAGRAVNKALANGRSTLTLCSQYLRAMAGDHSLLACRNDANVNPAVLSVDAFARLIICRMTNPHSQPLQPFAYLLPYLCAVFADAAGEYQTFQPAQRTCHRGDFPGDTKRE